MHFILWETWARTHYFASYFYEDPMQFWHKHSEPIGCVVRNLNQRYIWKWFW